MAKYRIKEDRGLSSYSTHFFTIEKQNTLLNRLIGRKEWIHDEKDFPRLYLSLDEAMEALAKGRDPFPEPEYPKYHYPPEPETAYIFH